MITQTFDLNLIPDQDPVVVHVDQFDIGTGRLVFNLFDGDIPYNPPAASEAHIQGTKPDKKGFMYLVQISGNTITANLTQQMSAVAGRTVANIVVMESEDRIGTFNFFIEVQRSALAPDVDLSESEIAYLEELVEEAKAATDEAMESALEAEAYARGSRRGIDVGPGDETYHNNSKYYSEQADDFAEDSEAWAKGTRDGAAVESTDESYHNNSKYYKELADGFAEDSEAWAKGTRDGVDVPSTDETYENNSKFYAEKAASDGEAWTRGTRGGVPVGESDETYHNNSKYYSEVSDGFSEDSEAWARGTRDGVDVSSGDETYHNNSKYYAEQAGDSASDAADSEQSAHDWAVGPSGAGDGTDTNNALYYSNLAKASELRAVAAETNAASSESVAKTAATEAESWAVGGTGTRTGEDTNNSAYWSAQAHTDAITADTAAARAEAYANLAIPRFVIANNRLYMMTDPRISFVLANNRLYIKIATA